MSDHREYAELGVIYDERRCAIAGRPVTRIEAPNYNYVLFSGLEDACRWLRRRTILYPPNKVWQDPETKRLVIQPDYSVAIACNPSTGHYF